MDEEGETGVADSLPMQWRRAGRKGGAGLKELLGPRRTGETLGERLARGVE